MKRGQAFEVFRLLIAAVVAGAILMVLLQILGSFTTPTQDPQKVAAQFVRDLSGYGGVRVSDPITFKKNMAIDLAAVAREASVPEDCVFGAVADDLRERFKKDGTTDIKDKGKVESGKTIVYTGSANLVARIWVGCQSLPSDKSKKKNVEVNIPDYGYTGKPQFDFSDCTQDIGCVVAILPK